MKRSARANHRPVAARSCQQTHICQYKISRLPLPRQIESRSEKNKVFLADTTILRCDWSQWYSAYR